MLQTVPDTALFLSLSLRYVCRCIITTSDNHSNFFGYLREKGLKYDTKLVENFLLSLKAKQFVILSGGSGTGKTKLAQSYAEYISQSEDVPIRFQTLMTLNKADDSGGFSISSEAIKTVLPPEAWCGEGSCNVCFGDKKIEGKITQVYRAFFNGDNKKQYSEEIRNLKNKIQPDPDTKKLKHVIDIEIPGKKSDSYYRVVPVGSNWTESRYITGYKNVISGKYVSTPSLDMILAADSNRTKPFFLILDEMNLSHVERYFSDVLSAMESGEPIYLDGNDPSSVKISGNLSVIGTVNQDETTYSFSPKVLDRANVIEFGSPSITDLLSSSEAVYEPSGNVEYLEDPRRGTDVRTKGAGELISDMVASDPGNREILGNVGNLLESFQNILKEMGFQMGFRSVDEIVRFLYVAWQYEGEGLFANHARYVDAQIMQKILPKIHGNLSIRDGLLNMKNLCAESGYCVSEVKLSDMVRILDGQRYVSFTS